MTSRIRSALAVALAAIALLSLSAPPGGPSGAALASHGPPDADAGPDQEVPAGTTVTLDGSGSLDPGHDLTFNWLLADNPGNAELHDPHTIHPTFTPNTTGTYVASLKVIDEQGRSDSDTVTIDVTATAAGQPDLQATLAEDSVIPGERTNLSVTLANTGGVDKGSVDEPAFTERIGTARGLDVSVGRESGGPLRVLTGNYALGSLGEGDATTLSVPVAVEATARPGHYEVPVNVSFAYTQWIDGEGNESSVRVERTLPLDLTVEAAPRFRVANVSTNLRVDDTDAVALTLENVGSAAATDATVTLTSSDAGLVVQGADAATRFVGEWPAGESRTVAFELTASARAGPQPYPLTLGVSWEDDGRTRTQRETVAVRPRPAGRFGVEPVDSTLSVDAIGRLEGTLTNEGSEPVEGAVVVLEDSPRTFLPGETEQVVGRLEPGESREFGFPIEVADDAVAGPHQVGVVVRYREVDGERRESDLLDLRTSVAPERRAISVAAADAAIVAGETGTIDVTVANEGEQTVRDLTVKAFPGGPLQAPADEETIDALAPGESRTVAFGLSAASAPAGKTYGVAFDIRYDAADGGTRFARAGRIPVHVGAPAEDGGGLPIVPVALVLGVAALVWYYRRR